MIYFIIAFFFINISYWYRRSPSCHICLKKSFSLNSSINKLTLCYRHKKSYQKEKWVKIHSFICDDTNSEEYLRLYERKCEMFKSDGYEVVFINDYELDEAEKIKSVVNIYALEKNKVKTYERLVMNSR